MQKIQKYRKYIKYKNTKIPKIQIIQENLKNTTIQKKYKNTQNIYKQTIQ